MAMKLALDTNRYSDLMRQLPEAIDVVASADSIFIPFIVLAELRYGFLKGGRARDNEAKLQRFIAEAGVDILWPSETTVDVFASLKLQLRKQGTPIPDHDLWIASLVLPLGIALYHRDGHFKHVPQLRQI